MVALTGITLTGLKYGHDNDHSAVIDDEDYEDGTIEDPVRYNPKFLYFNVHDTTRQTEKSVAKRSIDEPALYSIDDKNASMIDEFKREKVKQVEIRSRLRFNGREYFS